ncbi:MAG: hypothetical protein E7533_07520 [Ruminococcaceae bacterium]|nr:hypothetical protein [Oscillospiraceae bacterium]
MNCGNLIQYLIDERKFSKADIAGLLKTKEKNIDLFLVGQKEPSRKQIAYLEALCGATTETDDLKMLKYNIASDNGNIYRSRFIKQANHETLYSYYQKRFMADIITCKALAFFTFVAGFAVIALTAWFLFLNITEKPLTNVTIFYTAFIVPCVLILWSLFKIKSIPTKALIHSKSTYLKGYVGIMAGILCHNASLIYAGYSTMLLLVLWCVAFLASLLFVFSDCIFKYKPQKHLFKELFCGFLVAAPLLGYMFLFFKNTISTIDAEETVSDFTYRFFHLSNLMFLFTCFAFIFVFESMFIYRCALYLEKYYRPLPEKEPVNVKKSVIGVVAVILAVTISFSAFNIYSSKIIQDLVESIKSNGYYINELKEFDNYSVAFSDAEKVYTITEGNLTCDIPADLKIKEDTTIYSNKDNSVMLYCNIIYDYCGTDDLLLDAFDYNEYDATSKKALKQIRDIVEEKLGYYPRSALDWQKLSAKISEFDTSNKYEAAAFISIYLMTVYYTGDNTTHYIYQSEKVDGILSVTASPGGTIYSLNCCKSSNDYMDYSVTISISDEYESDSKELACKILNSIEIE